MGKTEAQSPERQFLPFYEDVRRFVGRRTACAQEAADLTQETFLRAFSAYREHRVAHPRRLLYRTARNLLTDRGRRERREPTPLERAGADLPGRSASGPFERLEQEEAVRIVRHTVDSLPARCREVFILNRFGGLSYREVAGRMNISPKTVEKHMLRAIEACRAALEAAAGE